MKRILALKKIKTQISDISYTMQRDQTPEATAKITHIVHLSLDMLIEQIQQDEASSVLESITRHA